MSQIEVWDSLLKYILAVNNKLTQIKESKDGEIVNFETLSPKLLPLNELSLDTDPIYTPYRGYRLLSYLSVLNETAQYLNDYFSNIYGISFDNFVYEAMGICFANQHKDPKLGFYYTVDEKSKSLFETLSQRFSSKESEKLLSIRKHPFYKSRNNGYVLTDNILLLEKTYNQFINDFWFDCIKDKVTQGGKQVIDIKKYKSIIGYFFESYVAETIKYSFESAKYYVIKMFSELKVPYKKNEIEIADLYIRMNNKIILGQVKVTSIYDKEKYGGDIDVFYKNDRNKFFDSFGLDQLVGSVLKLEETITQIDPKFPVKKGYKIFPIIVVNEKALQTLFMAKLFQDRFQELLSSNGVVKAHVYPVSLIHISDLENIQDFLHNNQNEIWALLKYHCRFPKFMPPFFNTINRRDIRPNYKRTMALLQELITKFQKK